MLLWTQRCSMPDLHVSVKSWAVHTCPLPSPLRRPCSPGSSLCECCPPTVGRNCLGQTRCEAVHRSVLSQPTSCEPSVRLNTDISEDGNFRRGEVGRDCLLSCRGDLIDSICSHLKWWYETGLNGAIRKKRKSKKVT